MNSAICMAAKEGLKIDENLVERLFIENCGLDDQRLAEILEGIKNQLNLKSITLKKTDIGMKSLVMMNNILI